MVRPKKHDEPTEQFAARIPASYAAAIRDGAKARKMSQADLLMRLVERAGLIGRPEPAATPQPTGRNRDVTPRPKAGAK